MVYCDPLRERQWEGAPRCHGMFGAACMEKAREDEEVKKVFPRHRNMEDDARGALMSFFEKKEVYCCPHCTVHGALIYSWASGHSLLPQVQSVSTAHGCVQRTPKTVPECALNMTSTKPKEKAALK